MNVNHFDPDLRAKRPYFLTLKFLLSSLFEKKGLSKSFSSKKCFLILEIGLFGKLNEFDGMYNQGEEMMSGVKVTLYSADGTEIANTKTDEKRRRDKERQH